MKFGVFDHLDNIFCSPSQFYKDRISLVRLYEKIGIYCYHIAEHHGTALGMAPSPNVFLSSLAQVTSTLRFGPMVYALPMYHPLRLAEEIAMLDHLSEGRMELGFGRGSSPVEKRFFGLSPDDADAQFPLYMEKVMTALSEGIFINPEQPTPFNQVNLAFTCFNGRMPTIWYGAHQPESAAKAALKGWNTINLDSAEEAAECSSAYTDAIHADKAPERLMGIGRFVVIADSDEKATQIARRAYAKWHTTFTHLARTLGRTQRHPRPDSWEQLCEQGKGVAGTPSKVIDFCAQQMDTAKTNYFVGQFAFGDMNLAELTESVSRFGQDVMPVLSPQKQACLV